MTPSGYAVGMAPDAPGWYADPEHPTTLQRRWDGERWTDDSRPTGYVTQPAGVPPAAPMAGTTQPMFGAPPAPDPDPVEAQEDAERRMSTAVVAIAVSVVLAVVALLLVLTGVF